MTPDATLHNPNPAYLRELVERTGLPQQAAARRIGISPRMMRYYLGTGDKGRPAPYLVQFALEALAKAAKRGRTCRAIGSNASGEMFDILDPASRRCLHGIRENTGSAGRVPA